MFPIAPFVSAVLAVIVTIAAEGDLRERRIPNWLVALALVLGAGLNYFLYGVAGLKNTGMGIGVALLVYVPLFVLRGMGGGDVKLMAAVGSLAGPGNWLRILILTVLVAGAFAVGLVLYRGAGQKVIRNLGQLMAGLFGAKAPYKSNPELDVTSGHGMSLPHGVFIAIGTISYLFSEIR